MWTGKSDLDHIESVGQFLHQAGFSYDNLKAIDLIDYATHGQRQSKDQEFRGDPLYVVIATK